MKFASVRELKSNASELLRSAAGGEGVIITSHGKPVASLQGLTENEIEDFILARHPEVRRSIDAAHREYKAKGGTRIEDVLSRMEKKSGTKKR